MEIPSKKLLVAFSAHCQMSLQIYIFLSKNNKLLFWKCRQKRYLKNVCIECISNHNLFSSQSFSGLDSSNHYSIDFALVPNNAIISSISKKALLFARRAIEMQICFLYNYLLGAFYGRFFYAAQHNFCTRQNVMRAYIQQS